ncbi:hypothetical protein [uncultured Clostridium sp.]|uniref:hypothetical protein n=1 Tax=uncultured Clostridium sp. TaxID=59620 RepID=UPI0025F05A53|nr:hypothetical protein [uncultured Clostridium sp.]
MCNKVTCRWNNSGHFCLNKRIDGDKLKCIDGVLILDVNGRKIRAINGEFKED